MRFSLLRVQEEPEQPDGDLLSEIVENKQMILVINTEVEVKEVINYLIYVCVGFQ